MSNYPTPRRGQVWRRQDYAAGLVFINSTTIDTIGYTFVGAASSGEMRLDKFLSTYKPFNESDANLQSTSTSSEKWHRIIAILDKIQIGGKRIVLTEIGEEAFLHLEYEEPDIHTGRMEIQRTREWLINTNATESDIVRTAYKAALASAEHQVGEHFLYEGKRIYSPHHDVNALKKLCGGDS